MAPWIQQATRIAWSLATVGQRIQRAGRPLLAWRSTLTDLTKGTQRLVVIAWTCPMATGVPIIGIRATIFRSLQQVQRPEPTPLWPGPSTAGARIQKEQALSPSRMWLPRS